MRIRDWSSDVCSSDRKHAAAERKHPRSAASRVSWLPASRAGSGAGSGGRVLHRGQRIDHAPRLLPIALAQFTRPGGEPFVGAVQPVPGDALLVLGHDQRKLFLQRTTLILHVADQRVLVVAVDEAFLVEAIDVFDPATVQGSVPAAEREVEGALVVALEQVDRRLRSDEHTSELQSLLRTSYAVFCLHKQT